MSDRGDRTEDPTPRKKREARKEGQIARSQDLVGWAGLLAATVVAGHTFSASHALVRDLLLRYERFVAEPAPGEALGLLGEALQRSVLVVLPLAAVMAAVGVAGNVAQVGWAPTFKTVAPKFKKINPFAGLKRMFSPASLWELAKTTGKVVLLAVVAWGPVSGMTAQLAASGRLGALEVAGAVGGSAVGLARRVAVAGLLLAAVDYGVQRRRTMKNMRMTKQEVKDEAKQSDGNPQMKGEIRSRAIKMSRNRMMASVADADVVVVNPTHVAVALKYEAGAGAPKVVAKGAGVVAQRIREEARSHGVPLVGDVPLARTLHRLCEVGDEIPGDMYEAVARVLAFVFSLRARGLAGGDVHTVPTFAGG